MGATNIGKNRHSLPIDNYKLHEVGKKAPGREEGCVVSTLLVFVFISNVWGLQNKVSC